MVCLEKGMLKRKTMDMVGSKWKNLFMKKLFAKSWAKHRELPEVAPQSFSKQWIDEHSPKKS